MSTPPEGFTRRHILKAIGVGSGTVVVAGTGLPCESAPVGLSGLSLSSLKLLGNGPTSPLDRAKVPKARWTLTQIACNMRWVITKLTNWTGSTSSRALRNGGTTATPAP